MIELIRAVTVVAGGCYTMNQAYPPPKLALKLAAPWHGYGGSSASIKTVRITHLPLTDVFCGL